MKRNEGPVLSAASCYAFINHNAFLADTIGVKNPPSHIGDIMDKDEKKPKPGLIEAHGGYRNLKSYQMTEIIYDATTAFCNRLIDRRSRTPDPIVQAAPGGKQNIAEGSMASGTSRKTELKLVGVARASLEELLLDYQDYLRQHGLVLWGEDNPQSQTVRKLASLKNRSYLTYRSYIAEADPEVAANTLSFVSSTRRI